MKKSLIKILVLSSIVNFFGCGEGIKDPTSNSSNLDSIPNAQYGKLWVEKYTTGQSMKMDLDGDGHYDVLVGFNGYDLNEKKASISTKSIHEKYDRDIKKSE